MLILAVFALTRVSGEADAPATGAAEAPPAAEPVRSGRLALRIGIAEGGGDRSATIEFGGPFQSRGADAVPAFDFELSVSGDGEPLRVGAVSTGDRGWITFDGKGQELPGDEWKSFAELRRETARLGAEAGGDEAAPLVDTSAVLVDERTVGTETIDGVETVHSSGRVDLAALLRELEGVMASQGPLAGVETDTTQAAQAVARTIGQVKADTYVGSDDGILRRLRLSTDFQVPSELRAELQGAESVKLELTLDLTAVNEQQAIEAPAEVGEPGEVGLEGVFGYGIAAGAVLGIDPPPGANSVDPARLSAGPAGAVAAGSGIPAGLERAIERGRVAVLVFTQDGGAEDEEVRAAVRSLRGVPVFVDDVRDIADYRPVVGELDIDRAPAVVVVGKDAKAQVIEGYVDAGSLRQLVEDAR